ncbi:hypothetical protein DNTS_023467 [Danionella cerebrum]|uniref:Transducer of regulated CREB activity N-terminal domain-containing protein n=1 Tax=Danionella cerebrum TaxID=2873325 RepID=A0A553R9H3_9TELE|nr:hypothetical protein DNTS_023467 [Danionella translucida]
MSSSAGPCGPTLGAVPTQTASAVPTPNSGASNPRKFSEKIALHTARQAEETAAFQRLMMDLSSSRGSCYGGSLPNVNQIGRIPSEFQSWSLSGSTRHHGLVERVQRERRFLSPSRPYRRQTEGSHISSPYLSPPPDPGWRR